MHGDVGAKTVGLTANPAAPMKPLADVFIAPVVGPEVIAGSSRMKAGTAQKLVLNMLSTATMVRLGRVFSHWMINVQLTNRKLRERGQRILISATGASPTRAAQTLKAAGGNLPVALLMLHKGIKRDEALQASDERKEHRCSSPRVHGRAATFCHSERSEESQHLKAQPVRNLKTISNPQTRWPYPDPRPQDPDSPRQWGGRPR